MTEPSVSSILSHGEQDVAGHLKANADIREIADARGTSEAEVEQAVDRIEEKTRRAFATLLQSPFLQDCAVDLTPQQRQTLIGALSNGDADRNTE